MGLTVFSDVYADMQAHVRNREADEPDEVWVVEHQPVYTLGQAGKPEHLLANTDIPVVHCDRGGQITYHGPGQLIIYVLLDLKRRNLGPKSLVRCLESVAIELLSDYGVVGERRDKAPGVYVDGRKIAALGLRIRRGYSYHGLSVNVNMDVSPYQSINPCGFPGLGVTQLADFEPSITVASVIPRMQELVTSTFSIPEQHIQTSRAPTRQAR